MPIPVAYETPELQSNEALKGFADTDSLGKAYLDLQGRVTGAGLDLLPEEIRKDPAIAAFKTLPELAKGYVETKKMVGGFEKAPEKAEMYKFNAPEKIHPGLKSEAIQNGLRGIFHEAGLGNKAADTVQAKVIGMLSAGMEKADIAKKENATKTETELRQAWGADYDKKVDGILKVMVAAGGADVLKETDAIRTAMKGSPTFLKTMGKIVGMLSEDSIGSLGDGDTPAITDKDAAQKRINEIIQTKSDAVLNDKHPEHKAIKEEWEKLQALLLK